jgi:hypothetical protein
MNKNYLSLVLAVTLATTASVLHALPFADAVTSFAGGNGFGVEDDSGGTYRGISGEGIYDPLAVTALDGAVLALGGATGTPGTITMHFSTGEVIDGAGSDLRLYDTFSFQDGFNLEISADGVSFANAFSFAGDLANFSCSPTSPCITDVDISGNEISVFNYLRITAAGNSGQGFPEAYTLDAVEALNYRPASVPEPGTLALLGLAASALAFIRRMK